MRLTVIASNQTEISMGSGATVLFSYNTPVAALVDGIAFASRKKYSNTTRKHIGAAVRRWGVDRLDVDQVVIDKIFAGKE